MSYLSILFFFLTITTATLSSYCFSITMDMNMDMDNNFHFTILHTNDLHSSFDGPGPDYYIDKLDTPQGKQIRGNYSRIITKIKELRFIKKHSGPVMLFDSGDFSSGSLYSMLGPNLNNTYVPELDFFRRADYDAITLGNHEFDSREEGLANILYKAKEQNLNTPLITTNLIITKKEGPLNNKNILKYLIKDYTFKGKNIRIGVLGALGPDAIIDAMPHLKNISFVGYNEKAHKSDLSSLASLLSKQAIELKTKYQADIILVLYHGGGGEDIKLAKKIKKGTINIILSGHTHNIYQTPYYINGMTIAQTGAYGTQIGMLEFDYNFTAKKLILLATNKNIIPITTDIKKDEAQDKMIEKYRTEINEIMTDKQYPNPHAYRFNDFVFQATQDLPYVSSNFDKLGRMVTSHIANALNLYLKNDPIQFYFTAISLIRSGIIAPNGKSTIYQYSDISRMLDIGFDKNFKLGEPVVTFYLTRSEIKWLIVGMEFYGYFKADAKPVFSDNLTYQKLFTLPYNIKIAGTQIDQCPSLIKVASTRYVVEHLKTFAQKTKNILSIVPKNSDGTPLGNNDYNQMNFPTEAQLFSNDFKFH